jgi:hypothetical protein
MSADVHLLLVPLSPSWPGGRAGGFPCLAAWILARSVKTSARPTVRSEAVVQPISASVILPDGLRSDPGLTAAQEVQAFKAVVEAQPRPRVHVASSTPSTARKAGRPPLPCPRRRQHRKPRAAQAGRSVASRLSRSPPSGPADHPGPEGRHPADHPGPEGRRPATHRRHGTYPRRPPRWQASPHPTGPSMH